MSMRSILVIVLLCGMVSVGACSRDGAPVETPSAEEVLNEVKYGGDHRPGRTSLVDVLAPRKPAGEIGAVNRYIWNAALETLNFLPVQTIDPFTGVIVTGFGTPPGGGRDYRATILIDDPALDARSLKLSLNTRRGPAPRETVIAVEDAILTRARQLRAEDSRF